MGHPNLATTQYGPKLLLRRSNLPLVIAALVTLHLDHFVLAHQSSFSIHSDIFSHPKYEIVFSNAPISEPDALALLHVPQPAPSDEAALSNDVMSSAHVATDGSSPPHSPERSSEHPPFPSTYELLTLPPSRYLCAIPVLEPPSSPPSSSDPLSNVAADTEAKEVIRASARGWELLDNMQGACLYLSTGWWSYSYCFGGEVVQFHALPALPGSPPVHDPSTHAYILGRETNTDTPGELGPGGAERPQADDGRDQELPEIRLMRAEGDQRFLVHQFAGGTICDLTGRERNVEIRYHCAPGTAVDRIQSIKEVATCAYLMVVSTPRLCTDAAFLPPKEAEPNAINCRLVVPEGDPRAGHKTANRLDGGEFGEKKTETGMEMGKDGKNMKQQSTQQSETNHGPPHHGTNIGGVVIGAHADPPHRGLAAANPLIPLGGPNGQQRQDSLPLNDDHDDQYGITDADLDRLGMDRQAVNRALRSMQALVEPDAAVRPRIVEMPGGGARLEAVLEFSLPIGQTEDGEVQTAAARERLRRQLEAEGLELDIDMRVESFGAADGGKGADGKAADKRENHDVESHGNGEEDQGKKGGHGQKREGAANTEQRGARGDALPARDEL